MTVRRAPEGSSYADQRQYVVAASLASLRGPVDGVVVLDRGLDWSGDRSYHLADAGDRQVMYQIVLNNAADAAALEDWLDGDTLLQMWPDLWLPKRLRAAWESRFPELSAPSTLSA